MSDRPTVPQDVADPELAGRLQDALNALAAPADNFTIYPTQFVPDLLFHALHLDVLELAQAAVLVIGGGLGRAAIPSVRAAMEAAEAMALLTAVPADYCRLGARLRAWEIVDQDELASRLEAALEATGLTPDVSRPTVAEIVAAEAEGWDHHAQGQGALLTQALADVLNGRKRGRRPHWSGLPVAERDGLVAPQEPAPEKALDALRGWQGMQTHPGSANMHREVEILGDGTLFTKPRPGEVDLAMAQLLTAATTASDALARRPLGGIAEPSLEG